MKRWELLRGVSAEMVDKCLEILFVSENDAMCKRLVKSVEEMSLRSIGEIICDLRKSADEDSGVLPGSQDSSAVQEEVVGFDRMKAIESAIVEAIDGDGSRKLISETRQKYLFVFDESNHHGILIEK